MNRTTVIVLKTIGVVLTLTLLVSAFVWGYAMRPSSDTCQAIVYILNDGKQREYVFRNELDALLRAEDINPVGRPIDKLSLQRIENAVRRHPMVRSAECYVTPWQEVRVNINQRVPLLRVQTPTETYLIDTDRRVMQARAAVKDSVLRVTGFVGQQQASTQLADFAEWLQGDDYWKQRIDHLYMKSTQMAYVCLRGTNQPRIVLGSLNDYERKLNKLRTFQENSGPATEGKHYEELDIRFKGQIIGRTENN
ncbi:MAG: hypothetical protein K6A36_06275 [Paludibacteraceae bacterium]|nr:hypothetical protein [Paludibacteraceae bacterium]